MAVAGGWRGFCCAPTSWKAMDGRGRFFHSLGHTINQCRLRRSILTLDTVIPAHAGLGFESRFFTI